MEKIYEKDQFEEQSFQYKKKSNLNGSVIMSFAVAFFAVFALIVCGFNEISYAAPDNSFAEKIHFYYYKKNGTEVSVMAEYNGKMIMAPLFFADQAFTKPLFCVEHDVPPSDDGAELLLINSNPAEGSNAEAGISYIISNSYVKGKKMLPANAPTDAEAFATQIAIWAYLYNKYPTNPDHELTQDQIAALVGADTLYYYDPTAADYEVVYEADSSIYKTYIEPVVLNALKASFTQRVIITKGNDNVTKVEDGKYYQTAKISISGDPDSELVSYDVVFKGVEGAFAVNATDGTKIESLSNIPKGTEFYVRVPVDKVTQSLQELQIEVSGHFNTFATNDYGEGENQKVISVDDATRIFVKGTDYDLVGTPDTGMSAAQTIYFIGLIVLLCGVGIVYANAKPIENN